MPKEKLKYLRIFQEIAYLCMQSMSGGDAELLIYNEMLCQFILLTSMNFKEKLTLMIQCLDYLFFILVLSNNVDQ